jgi:hypothetical protein
LLSVNKIFFSNGISCERSSYFERMIAHHRRGGEKSIRERIDIAKRLGLSPSTLNTIIAKKKEISEQADKCGAPAKKMKTGKVLTSRELENVLFAWYHQAFLWMGASCGRNSSK